MTTDGPRSEASTTRVVLSPGIASSFDGTRRRSAVCVSCHDATGAVTVPYRGVDLHDAARTAAEEVRARSPPTVCVRHRASLVRCFSAAAVDAAECRLDAAARATGARLVTGTV